MTELKRWAKGDAPSAGRFNRHQDATMRNTPALSPHISRTDAGWTLASPEAPGVMPYRRIFDLYDVRAAKCKVRGTTDDKLVCLVSQWIAITGGTHELDADITISANTYIYITIHRNTTGSVGTAKLESGATLPNGDEDDEHIPLWYLPWDSGNSRINRAGIIDMRGTVHVTALA